jgi:hypothetical protein
MIELTPTAQSRLDAYFQELRRVLSGSRSVDPADVERDVRDHIDAALVGSAPPIEASALDAVLHKLGSPTQWLRDAEPRAGRISPAESLADLKHMFLQVAAQLAGGPESYRLAYLSFLIFVAGWFLALVGGGRVGPLSLAVPISFVFSRAALSLFTAQRLTGGQKWLLYPSLLFVYGLLIVMILMIPFFASLALFEMRESRSVIITNAESDLIFFIILAVVWLGVGVGGVVFPGAVRDVFYPFAERFSRRAGMGLATLGLGVLLVAGAYLFSAGRAEQRVRKLPPIPPGRVSSMKK